VKITDKQFRSMARSGRPVILTDIAGTSAIVTLLDRRLDGKRVKISYIEASGRNGLMEMASIARIDPTPDSHTSHIAAHYDAMAHRLSELSHRFRGNLALSMSAAMQAGDARVFATIERRKGA
jgi:hypothetical protein